MGLHIMPLYALCRVSKMQIHFIHTRTHMRVGINTVMRSNPGFELYSEGSRGGRRRTNQQGSGWISPLFPPNPTSSKEGETRQTFRSLSKHTQWGFVHPRPLLRVAETELSKTVKNKTFRSGGWKITCKHEAEGIISPEVLIAVSSHSVLTINDSRMAGRDLLPIKKCRLGPNKHTQNKAIKDLPECGKTEKEA